MKVFISYNHKDQATAFKIKERLAAESFKVVIDAEKMQSGQDIRQFILECIRESGVTLSVISANSLMSAWVAMETITSGVDGDLRNRVFIPGYIDRSFFELDFTAQAMEKIDAELAEIDRLMRTALDKDWGIEDLQAERTRYRTLCNALPEIVGKLRNSLCIDLTPEHFEEGMEKIIADLKKKGGASDAKPSPLKAQATEDISSLQATISGILDESSRQRLEGISKRLITLQELLDKYQQELDFETDPKRQMRYERDIASTRQSIEKLLIEVKSYEPLTP